MALCFCRSGVLIKRETTLSAPCENTEKAAVPMGGRGIASETKLAGTLIMDSPDFRTVRKHISIL